MPCEDLNIIDETREQALQETGLLYIESMCAILGCDDETTKADLLREYYDSLLVVSGDPRKVHHGLSHGYTEAEHELSILVLEIQLHRICNKIAQTLSLEFSEKLSLGANAQEIEDTLQNSLL